MFEMKELLGKYKFDDQDKEIQDNLLILLDKMNDVRKAYGQIMIVSSGLRSITDQMRINPRSPKSSHIQGQAVDIVDKNGELREWVLKNIKFMEDLGLYFEDFRYTSGWVHFSIAAPKSGKRIFIPYAGPIPHPELWDGKY